MERVYEEFGESKSEIEKLKEECGTKTDLSNKLKKAHDAQLFKFQEVSSKFENQAQELHEKTEEISNVKQIYEETKFSLNEKESIIKNLSFANEKLRTDSIEKFRKWEMEKRDLVMALEEASENSKNEELRICALNEEIKGLKGLLCISQKKCLDAEEKAEASKELKQRDGMLEKYEEQNRNVEHELKWKKEQFQHLEEAHAKLQDHIRASKEEWDIEKSNLVDEICSFQASLDSQTRISEDLKTRLERCNQALAHEETKRKCAEVQLSEAKSAYENVLGECEESKLKMECLILQRDNDVASLRNSLGSKETLFKEMEYQSRKLEQENQELIISLKELQEAQIHQSGTSSLMGKLKIRLKNLEQVHKNCSANLKAKEVEWCSQLKKMEDDFNECLAKLNCKDAAIDELKLKLEKLKTVDTDFSDNLKAKESHWSIRLDNITGDLNRCKCEMENQDKIVDELKCELEIKGKIIEELKVGLGSKCEMENEDKIVNELKCELEIKGKIIEEIEVELKGCYDSIMQLKVQSEETSMMLSAYKTGFANAQSKAGIEKTELDEKINLLIAELKAKNIALTNAKNEIEEEREKAYRTGFTDAQLTAEFDKNEFDEKVIVLITQLEVKSIALTNAHNEIEEERKKAYKTGFTEAQLSAEIERAEFGEKVNLLITQLEAKNVALINAQNEIEEERKKAYKTGFTEAQSSAEIERAEFGEKVNLLITQMEAKNVALINAQNEIEEEREKTESLSRKIKNLDEKVNLLEVKNIALTNAQNEIEEESAKAESLLRKIESLGEKTETHNLVMQEELEKYKQMELDLKERLSEACEALDKANYEKITEANEIEFEMQIWKSTAEQLKVELEESREMRKQLEFSLLSQMEVEEVLKTEKQSLAHALGDIGQFSDKISELSGEDVQLMGTLGKIVEAFNTSDLHLKENQNVIDLSLVKKKFEEAISGERSPFREINSSI